jgi:hypothetical protein
MSAALIGHTGFVGQTLLRQRSFEAVYRSTNIAQIDGCLFDMVVCAGAPAQKWIANRDPASDLANIEKLTRHLDRVRCDFCVLISTVDVFCSPVGVDEESPTPEAGLHAYGTNRLRLERFVRDRFPRHLIVRLPGLVGPGLRKNVIFDLLNNNMLEKLDPRSVFQFYPMVNLWPDTAAMIQAGLSMVHLTAEPVTVDEIARVGFGLELGVRSGPPPVQYDFQSRHADLLQGVGRYQYSRRETLLAVRHYAQSESRALTT